MNNFFYRLLFAVVLVFLFYIIFDVKPNGLILTVIGLSIIYLIVIFIKNIFSKSKEKE